MDNKTILNLLNKYYPLNFTEIEPLREGGNVTYAANSLQGKFFLKIVGSAFSQTILSSLDINLYLQKKGFAVPEIIMTEDNSPFVGYEEKHLIVYEFLDNEEIDIMKEAERVGETIGELHNLMEDYSGKLSFHDKEFYIDRYIEILRIKGYSGAEKFAEYGERLWGRVKDLPRGYCHGDMYCGNIEKGSDGKLYILDFDTSHKGFPLYDLALICNQTDYFKFNPRGLAETASIYERLLPEYLKRRSLTDCGLRPLFDMIALYHFALQATIIEINGSDCVDDKFFDSQLNWLKSWVEQCDRQI